MPSLPQLAIERGTRELTPEELEMVAGSTNCTTLTCERKGGGQEDCRTTNEICD
jgi:hypothetical protein